MKISNFNCKNTKVIMYFTLLLISVVVVIFTFKNESFYGRTIAKITYISQSKTNTYSEDKNAEQLTIQNVKATIVNGKLKGREINFKNTASYSGVNDIYLKTGDEVFVSVKQSKYGKITYVKVIDLKRDKYVVAAAVLFIILILFVGRTRGLRALLSVAINIIIFCIAIEMFLKNFNILIIFCAASLIFIVLSILLAIGLNKKSVSAIAGTVLGTFISMSIAFIAIKVNNANGVHFEELEFLTHPPENIFYSEVLVGTIGAVMDIAISISSSINEIYEKNPAIRMKELIVSEMEIGKDIMGTMANTLAFAYISGSIPLIVLYLRNEMPIFSIIQTNLSLEIIRALVGSIGIVLSIPISIFTSVLIFKNNRNGEIQL
ncbi:MAG: YibE/F family protein [Clostridium sp.]|nr:YibE/F family protein [Clostridium sp.]